MNLKGNPDFGIKYKADTIGEKAMHKNLCVKVPEEIFNKINRIYGDKKSEFLRELIIKALSELD